MCNYIFSFSSLLIFSCTPFCQLPIWPEFHTLNVFISMSPALWSCLPHRTSRYRVHVWTLRTYARHRGSCTGVAFCSHCCRRCGSVHRLHRIGSSCGVEGLKDGRFVTGSIDGTVNIVYRPMHSWYYAPLNMSTWASASACILSRVPCEPIRLTHLPPQGP